MTDESTADPELEGILAFLRTAERLKSTPRSGWTTAGEKESVAAHTWRLSLMAAVLSDRFPGIDLARLLKICLIHDLGEALHGDVPAPLQKPEAGKAARERDDLREVLSPLPERLRQQLLALWDEYEAAETPEAQLAKGLDKLETILQHTQGLNPADFDYRFNLTYGQAYTAAHPILAAIRARLDQATEARAGTPSEHGADPGSRGPRLHRLRRPPRVRRGDRALRGRARPARGVRAAGARGAGGCDGRAACAPLGREARAPDHRGAHDRRHRGLPHLHVRPAAAGVADGVVRSRRRSGSLPR